MPPRLHMHVFSKAIHHQALVCSIALKIQCQVQEHTENQVI
jgi:hypothetical protein